MLEWLAVMASGLFTGAAICINLVEHPARMACGTEIAMAQWTPGYKRASVMQVSLALVATLAGLLRWIAGGGAAWGASAALIFSVIPFTAIVVLPTNKRLLAPALDRNAAETGRLLQRWRRLHAVRSVLSALALGIFVWLASRP